MRTKKPVLLIPVENQVRELDAKLLLACIAARRGLTSIMGAKREVESRIASFPKSVYIAKSMVQGNSEFLRLAGELGHANVAWDEESLVHLPAETYFSRRLSPDALAHVSHLFAWGEDNAELWRKYPGLPAGVPIHITGNPRNDLLRSEIRAYYDKEVNEIHRNFGDFILINTNFNHVNAYLPGRNLFVPVDNAGDEPEFGRAARGMPRDYAEGLHNFKQATFEGFQKLIPVLEKAFPFHRIIVRPHPTESHEAYRHVAEKCERVEVTNKGNVVPWLMAARAVIHNGCTTGVEAYVMRVPAVSYRVTVDERFDEGFYALPNRLSHQCFNFDQIKETLGKIFAGELGAAGGDERLSLIDHHLAGIKGPLASERIVDVLEMIVHDLSKLPGPPFWGRLKKLYKAAKRRRRKRLKQSSAHSDRSIEFQRHKYPAISIEEFRSRLAKFQLVLGNDCNLMVDQIYTTLFRIRARG
jgi:surface carbohydrate biosynthesis protein